MPEPSYQVERNICSRKIAASDRGEEDLLAVTTETTVADCASAGRFERCYYPSRATMHRCALPLGWARAEL